MTSVGSGGQGPGLGKIGTERQAAANLVKSGAQLAGRGGSLPPQPRHGNSTALHQNPVAARQAGQKFAPIKHRKTTKSGKSDKSKKKKKAKKAKGKSLTAVEAIGGVKEQLKKKYKDPRELLARLEKLLKKNGKYRLKERNLGEFRSGVLSLFDGIEPTSNIAGKRVNNNVVSLVNKHFETKNFIKADYVDFYDFMDDLLSTEEFKETADLAKDLLKQGKQEQENEVLSDLVKKAGKIDGKEPDADTVKASQSLWEASNKGEISTSIQDTFSTMCSLVDQKVEKNRSLTKPKALKSVYKDLMVLLGKEARTIQENGGVITTAPGQAGRDNAKISNLKQAARDAAKIVDAAKKEHEKQIEQEKKEKSGGAK